MAAVAAASAELLIIGWYIFRVLLQVSVPGFRVGEGSRCAPLNRQAHVAIAVSPTCPILIAAIPAYPSAAASTTRPHPLAPCALLPAQTLLSAPAPGREQRVGARRAPAADERRGS